MRNENLVTGYLLPGSVAGMVLAVIVWLLGPALTPAPATAQTTVLPPANYRLFLPLVANQTWWSAETVCPPGEEIDRAGYNAAPGDNDMPVAWPNPSFPLPARCVGWLHAETYGDTTGPDGDYYYYEIPPEVDGQATVHIALTHLPANYNLSWYTPSGGWQEEPTELHTFTPGTAEEHLYVPARQGVNRIYVWGGEITAYDDDNPYLLTIEVVQ